MNNIKLIVGLANPGLDYADTRHNVGSWYVKLLANYYHRTLKEKTKFLGNTTTYSSLGGKNIHLLIPNTFMNLSGQAVRAIVSFYRINLEEILIAHDEMHLPPGIVKFKLGGGHGGHNGLKNIINTLGNNNFHRLRIGIGYPENCDKMTNFVLSKPLTNEKKLIDNAIKEALYCTHLWFEKEEKIKAINRLNGFRAI
ncbi:aminoacyl-tRNA hydrolase [Pantoea sp. Aalb]|uniref:aminoacyl-tRNA hydrolase n=1 Tax=Pantoea sp. Aalb TaxID=2576762 RepID=UPI001329B8F1|nr:aminoacyl-tRNA hydrolase [Pantoea sp. Aalb]MXP67347.1 aminoacyl-tRNA hydrolase [Pantoea sp. Aalb]